MNKCLLNREIDFDIFELPIGFKEKIGKIS